MRPARNEKVRGLRWRGWTALGVAYLLALQLLVAGFVAGAHAAPGAVDILGNVICSTQAASDGGQAPQEDRAHVPNCCVQGCTQSATPLAAKAAASFIAPPAIVLLPRDLDQTVLRPVADRHRGSQARAPPPAA
jgi:hypothetical protein